VATRKLWFQNRTINLPPVTAFSEKDGYYLIDVIQLPVVEFLHSFTISQMMLPGRLQAGHDMF